MSELAVEILNSRLLRYERIHGKKPTFIICSKEYISTLKQDCYELCKVADISRVNHILGMKIIYSPFLDNHSEFNYILGEEIA